MEPAESHPRQIDLSDPEQVASLTPGEWIVDVRDEGGRRVATATRVAAGKRRKSTSRTRAKRHAVDEQSEPLPRSSLWKVVGTLSLEGPTDIAANKHKYLADAYEDHRG